MFICVLVHPVLFTQLLCRDRANADLSHLHVPRWQNIRNSSLMMEHELFEQYCHQPGDVNMPHEHEDFNF